MAFNLGLASVGTHLGRALRTAFRRDAWHARSASGIPPLGVDISASAVRALQLDTTGTLIRGWGVAELPAGAVAGGRVVQPDAVSAALRTALEPIPQHDHEIRIALPSKAVLQQKIDLPDSLSSRDADLLARDAAAQLTRQPREAVLHDYFREGAEGPYTLMAARRENVDERIAALTAAGIRCNAVDVEQYALLAGLANQIKDIEERLFCMTLAVVDLSGDALQILVLRENMLYQAEQFVTGRDPAALISGVDRLVQQYRAAYFSVDIEILIIEGMPEMVDRLSEALGIEAVAAAPFMGLTPPPQGLPPADGWARACGLARRGRALRSSC